MVAVDTLSKAESNQMKTHKFLKLCARVLVLAGLMLTVGCKLVDKAELPQLLNDLKHQDSHVRSKAAMRIAGLEEDGVEAVPALIETLSDINGGVRSSAAFALRKIGTPEAKQALANYN